MARHRGPVRSQVELGNEEGRLVPKFYLGTLSAESLGPHRENCSGGSATTLHIQQKRRDGQERGSSGSSIGAEYGANRQNRSTFAKPAIIRNHVIV